MTDLSPNTESERPLQQWSTLGRVYFLALIPFVGTVAAPWILGPGAALDNLVFVVWSFTVLVFCNAAHFGFGLGAKERFIYLHGIIILVLCAFALTSLFLALRPAANFAGLALLTVSHWLSWLWLQKSRTLSTEFFKQHNRFVWTILACHMLVLFNVIYIATRVPSS